MPKYRISVPATSANIGPGFDTLGIALSLFLNLDVSVESPDFDPLLLPTPPSSKNIQYNIQLSYSEFDSSIPLEPDTNIISRVALFVLNTFGIQKFPTFTKVFVENNIPLSRGLGSSATAIVSGVFLANVVCDLKLTEQQMFSFCLAFENHPDNTTPAIVGGITASYVLGSEIMSESSTPSKAIYDINKVFGVNVKYNSKIKAVVAVPRFELPTSLARSVLPKQYEIKDIVYNFQRIATLSVALGAEDLSPEIIYNSMKDKIHQPYRKALVPGLSKVLDEVCPQNTPGLIGVCLSGAGPTTLALATSNFEEIGAKLKSIFDSESKGTFETDIFILDIVDRGATAKSL
ncbi:hypothetical protein BB559_001331 [Furculomyces boomerangus]|uniref:Homoserine kinase n=2 Tax=Harpellales TaxID=61421 RepID=A0A2T9Z2B7_9FUNG|nr:hypothetical protein BB559_001331 [Furculomyces boomerangus]PVZ98341.1 hypothetical protein BB558_005655 [Smittium angustum]